MRAPVDQARTPVVEVRSLPWRGDDVRLVAALREGNPGAPAAFYDRYAVHVRRVLGRILGADAELADVLHEVFARALVDVAKLQDPERLEAWLTSIAVFTARGWIRRRQRRRWLRFFAPSDLPDVGVREDHEGREAMRRTYALLEKLPADERIAFALRFVEGMELTEVADACEVSLATIKRRLRKGRMRFQKLALRDPVLRHRVRGEGQ